MRRFVSILLFATLLAFAFAYSSLLPQRAMAASASTLQAQQITDATAQPSTGNRWGHGYWNGYHDGYNDGYEIGLTACYDFHRHYNGWTNDGDRSYRDGYARGFSKGYDAGRHDCYDRGYDRDSHHGHNGDHNHNWDNNNNRDKNKHN
jgi:hypothetical protein